MRSSMAWFASTWLLLGCAGCGDDDAGASVDAGASFDAGASVDTGAPGPGWSTLPALPRGPRQETAVVALGRSIYVIGGFDRASAVVPTVEAFDVDSNLWRDVAALPEPLHHVNAAVVDGKLYVLGGLRTLSFTPVGRSYVYDPAANSWTPRAAMPAGSERGAACTGAIAGKIYLAGGFAGGAVKTLSAYDVAADSWEVGLPELPEVTDHGAGVAVGVPGGVLLAIGGRAGAIGSHRTTVYAYDPVQRAWSARQAMPTSRGGAAAALVGTRVIVAGGEGNGAVGSGVFATVEAYDPVADRWSALPDMTTPRHGTGAASLDGRFYMPGGADRQAFAAVATVEVFTP